MKPFYTNVDRYKNHILYRGIDSSGKRIEKKIKFKPKFYLSCDYPSQYKSIYDEDLELKQFDSISKAREYIKKYENVRGFRLYGQVNYVNQYIQNEHKSEIEYDNNKISIVNIDIEVESADGFPDAMLAEKEIICITMYESISDTYYIISNKKFGDVDKSRFKKYIKDGLKIKVIEQSDEDALLKAFIKLWTDYFKYPDIITGWNVKNFDIPYIINRMRKKFPFRTVQKSLSIWGKIVEETKKGMYGKDENSFKLLGTTILDYMEIYKKFQLTKRESYKLDYIASVELGENKLSYDEYTSMYDFYLKDYAKFVEYNLKDVVLVNRLDNKLKLIDLATSIAYMTKVNYCDVVYSVRVVESLCYSYLLQKNIIMDAKVGKKSRDKQVYEGAYVKDPLVGMHGFIASFDLDSLYPNVICQLNISPETIVEEENHNIRIDDMIEKKTNFDYLKQKNWTVSANGCHFSKEKQGFLPELISSFLLDNRKNVKKSMLEDEQKLEKIKHDLKTNPEDKKLLKKKDQLEMSISSKNMKQKSLKVINNSIYGATANEYFVLYDIRIAEAITLYGQYITRKIVHEMNNFLGKINRNPNKDYVIAGDTDSIYISAQEIVDKLRQIYNLHKIEDKIEYLDRFCEKKIVPFLETVYADVAEYTNAFQNRMRMKRECLASCGFWKAKKMYALLLYDNEHVRYDEPKLKIMGLETQRSSTPEWCRNKMKECIYKILTEGETAVQKYIKQVREEFYELDCIEYAFPRGVNNIEKWLEDGQIKTGCPINVRASICYNTMIVNSGLDKKYELIKSGDKIKYVYLKEINPFKIPVFGFTDVLPKELGIDEYIDVDKMFEKTFLTPIENILKVLGWQIEQTHAVLFA